MRPPAIFPGPLFVPLTATLISGAVSLPAMAAAPGDLDPAFVPPAMTYLGSSFPAFKHAIAVQADGRILVGGNFDAPRSLIVRLNADGSLDDSFNAPLQTQSSSDEVYDIVVQPDGRILAAGYFAVGGQRRALVRLYDDGSLDEGFNVTIDGATFGGLVYRMIREPDGKIIVGSNDLDTVNGVTVESVARLNTDGSLAAPLGSAAGLGHFSVFAMARQPDGKIILGGTASMVRIDANGIPDPDFALLDFEFNDAVDAIALQADGRILFTGRSSFGINGIPRKGLVRLLPDGNIDESFAPMNIRDGHSLLVQPDGKIIVGGSYVQDSGFFLTGISRLFPDGSRDGFIANGGGPDNVVFDLALQGDGKILAAGAFEYFSQGTENITSPGVVRLENPIYTLSGSIGTPANIVVDDGLTVFLNGVTIYTDGDATSGSRPPISFSARVGDRVRLVVRDTYGVCSSLSPVYLIDPAGTGVLVDPGFSRGCDRPGTDQGVSHDVTFTIDPPTDSFAAWKNASFSAAELADPGISGPAADAENDSIPNLIEYALGLNPKVIDPAQWQAGTQTVGPDAFLTITFTVPQFGLPPDVTLIVEEAPVPVPGAAWTTLAVRAGAGPWTPLSGAVITDGPAVDGRIPVTVRSPNPVGNANNSAFLRLRAEVM